MRITKIKIDNFRLLKKFSIDLEKDLSLVIGKNNTGKTSLLSALDCFLNGKKLTYDDFNTDLRDEFDQLILNPVNENDFVPKWIKLRIIIEYDDNDDLSSVSKLLMSLNPDDRMITLEFTYELNYTNYLQLQDDFRKNKYADPSEILKAHHEDYFDRVKKSIASDDEKRFVDLDKENILLKNILNFKYISAKRDVTNKENDKTLSLQTSKIYKRTSETDEQKVVVEQFKDKLKQTDKSLSEIYCNLFKEVIEKVKRFGGVKNENTQISIASTLQHRELLDGNTTVFYNHAHHNLPEYYNGLGYMNLISMIFELEVLLAQFKHSGEEIPAAINLLFIEEPEAHTHPQMQYVFINNIKALLAESKEIGDNQKLNLQTIVSTHSSHIVAECDFDDIKYLKRISPNSVDSSNLSSLKYKYENADNDPHFRFLKQYLTLNRSELFFADKMILIEGDTERILLPAMMKKIDQDHVDANITPLLSQNISIVEIGAHSKTFEQFIDFIGIKTLIITDLDSNYYTDENVGDKTSRRFFAPNEPDANETTNTSLCFFLSKKPSDLKAIMALNKKDKILSKVDGSWAPNSDGKVFIAYQTEQNEKYARSFEDSFWWLNKDFLKSAGHTKFPSLTKTWYDKYIADEVSPLEFSERGVNSKPSLAIEVLLNSTTDNETKKEFSNWQIPAYIEEGLLWLRKN